MGDDVGAGSGEGEGTASGADGGASAGLDGVGVGDGIKGASVGAGLLVGEGTAGTGDGVGVQDIVPKTRAITTRATDSSLFTALSFPCRHFSLVPLRGRCQSTLKDRIVRGYFRLNEKPRSVQQVTEVGRRTNRHLIEITNHTESQILSTAWRTAMRLHSGTVTG